MVGRVTRSPTSISGVSSKIVPQQTTQTYRSGLLWLLCTAGVGLALDLWTKQASAERFSPPQAICELIPGYLHLTAVRNYGAVFGLGQGGRWLFVLVSFAAIAFVLYMFSRSPRRWWHDLTLGMLLAGILGNLYDRLAIGYVRDMIHVFPRWPNVFPWVFNIADSLLCISIGILVVTGLVMPEPEQDDESATQQP